MEPQRESPAYGSRGVSLSWAVAGSLAPDSCRVAGGLLAKSPDFPGPCGGPLPGQAATCPELSEVPAFLFNEERRKPYKPFASWPQEGPYPAELAAKVETLPVYRREFSEEEDARLPEWGGQALPAELVLQALDLRAQALFEAVCGFFQDGAPAEVHDSNVATATVRATVFVDLAPVELEVTVLRPCRGAGAASVAVLRHPPRCDVVRHHRLAQDLASFLKGRGHRVCGPAVGRPGLPGSLLDDDDDFLLEAWPTEAKLVEQTASLEPLIRALDAPCRERGAEAAVALARLAEAVPACRRALAMKLVERCDSLARAFGAPASTSQLALQYPLAATVAVLSLHPESAEVLAGTLKPMLAEQVLCSTDMPTLLKTMLTRVIKLLRSQTPAQPMHLGCTA